MDAMDAGSTRPRASPGDVAMTSETGAQEPLLSLEMAVEDNDGDDHSCVSTTEEAPLLTLLNDTVSQIGMGTFQWALFGLCGMGGAHLTRLSMAAFKLTGVTYEHRLSEQESGLILSSFMVGMIIGAGVWGPLSDRIGRKPAFSTTLLLTSLFGTLAAFSPSYPVLCLLLCLMGTGVGGNLPTDGALFLEFIPREHQGLLTLLSLFWPVGSVVSSAVAWALIPPFSCSPPTVGGLCSQEENRGWRYVILTLGGATLLTLIGRSLLFNLKESPKFLLTQGRCQEAMDVLEYLADKNGVQLCLPEKEIWEGLYETEQLQAKSSTQNQRSFSHKLAFLFARPLWLTTTLVWTLWALCSFGYTVFNGFLPKYLESQGGTPVPVDEVYERYVIISAAGIPGSFLGWYLVDTHLGRKGTMALSTFGTALALYLSTVFTSAEGQLWTSSSASFLQNTMWGVVYSYSPEVFPTSVRGTAVGMASSLARVLGSTAPLATGALLQVSLQAPLYLSSAALCGAALCMILLPIETRGRAAH